MLKVIIVDDEPYIVQGLSMIIDWNTAGYEIIGTANDGEEALELIKSMDPDLVITDIKMPIMTGLELLEKVRVEKITDANFVILSGYNDFEYAKTAIRFGSIDYLVKPIDKEELLGVLERVRNTTVRVERQEEANSTTGTDSYVKEFLSSLEKSGNSPDEISSSTEIKKDLMDELLHAIETNQKDKIEEFSEEFFAYTTHSEEHLVRLAINYVIFGLLHLAVAIDSDINQKEILTNILSSTLDSDAHTETDSSNITSAFLEFGEYLVQLRGNQSQNSLSLVEEDIRTRYMENLTLKELGKKYFINSAYLGQIFKKQYGESFKDYLNKIRMIKAEELLLNSDLKIHDIAEQVGYGDVDYFINRFILYAGCTPAKFRKQTH